MRKRVRTRNSDGLNIALDTKAELSLQQQLRRKIIDSIQTGVLLPDRQLPSTRSLAIRLGISRNTVSLAYEALIAEGHLVSKIRSGIFVAQDMLRSRIAVKNRNKQPSTILSQKFTTPIEDKRFRCPNNWHQYPFPFIDGCVNAELLPIAEWRESMHLATTRHEAESWNLGTGNVDDLTLLNEIRTKVLPLRSIEAGGDELLMTMSVRNALQLVGELLIRRGTPVVLEEPADADFEQRLKDKQAIIYKLDPSLKTGLPQGAIVVTSARRKFKAGSSKARNLLKAVSHANGVLIEHDMPPGARDSSKISPALHALDEQGRVIYIGCLAPVISCGAPMGMIVAELGIIEQLRHIRNAQGTAPPYILQRAWAHFISLGHYVASLQRAGKILDSRRLALRDALNHYLHKFVRIETLPGASAYWVSLPKDINSHDFIRQAAALGILMEQTQFEGGRVAICMGVTGLNEKQIRQGVQNLKRLLSGDLAKKQNLLKNESTRPLSDQTLEKTMSGLTLLYNTVYGDPAMIEVHANGELIGKAGYTNEDCDSGRWWIEDGRWFRQWQKWAYGEPSSYYIVIKDDQLHWYDIEGILVDTALISR